MTTICVNNSKQRTNDESREQVTVPELDEAKGYYTDEISENTL